MNSQTSIDSTTIKQYSSIVVEAVMLAMSAVGIPVKQGEHAIEQGVDEAAHVIHTNSKFQRAIQKFIELWNNVGSGPSQKAEAVFHLMKETYLASILHTIVKSICSRMHWYEWLETAVKVIAMIVAALATEGGAIIAEIALMVMSAVDFSRKIENIGHLSRIKDEIL